MAKILGSKQGSIVRFSAYCNYHLLRLAKAVRNENIKRGKSNKVLQLPMRYSTQLLKSILSDLIVDSIWISFEKPCHLVDSVRQTKHCFELDCDDDFDLRLLERIGSRKSNSLDKLLIFWLFKNGNLSWYEERFTYCSTLFDETTTNFCRIAFHFANPDTYFDEYVIEDMGCKRKRAPNETSLGQWIRDEERDKITFIS